MVDAGAALDGHLHRTITGQFHIHDVPFQIDLDRLIERENGGQTIENRFVSGLVDGLSKRMPIS